MLINKAFASDVAADAATEAAAAADANPMATIGTQFLWLIAVVALFYVLLIMPQKKRFKEHKEMLDMLKKGDKVITAGGLLGTIENISDDSDEIVLDMGHGTKVSALRSTIHKKHDEDTKKKDDKKEDKK